MAETFAAIAPAGSACQSQEHVSVHAAAANLTHRNALRGDSSRRSNFVKTAAISITLLITALIAAVSFPVLSIAQELRLQIGPEHFRFEREDEKANEGKRASCEVYG